MFIWEILWRMKSEKIVVWLHCGVCINMVHFILVEIMKKCLHIDLKEGIILDK